MGLKKSKLTLEEAAQEYESLAESVLAAMVDCSLNLNFSPVFILKRPFLEACFKGMWLCLADPSTQIGVDSDIDLLKLAKKIDMLIDPQFEKWDAPFAGGHKSARYSMFLLSPVMKGLSDRSRLKSTTVIERLHNDIHSSLPSLEFMDAMKRSGGLVHAAKELCVVGWDPFLLNLRFALARRFANSTVARQGILNSPLAGAVLRVMELPE